jgi:phospholipase C
MRNGVLLIFLSIPVTSCTLFVDPDDADHGPPCATTADPGPGRDECAYGQGALARETIACPSSGDRIPIDHIIVLMQENRSFDHYLGHLRGQGQDDVDVPDETTSSPDVNGAPVAWHHLSDNCFDDPNHSWSGSHSAWNQGRNDGFVLASMGPNDPGGNDPSGSRTMGYYDGSDIPFYYQLASTFAISDRYFSDVMGPTLPNRLYLYAGTSFGLVGGDVDVGYHRTIFRAMNEAGVSWKVYQSDAAAAFSTASFLVDSIGKVHGIDDFEEDARRGTLPDVAFVDPTFLDARAALTDEGPPADMQLGQAFVFRQVSALMSSPNWSSSAMFITYDEGGGLYDHVAPPSACAPGATPPVQEADLGGFDRYGFRVPVFVVSPFAKAHFVSHAVHSHASILRFIEARFGLRALTARDANADAMLDMFDFARPPFATPPDLAPPGVDPAKLDACRARYP